MANLTRLSLSSNQIGDTGLSALSGALASGALARCQKLFLQENKIGDVGCSALADACGRSALARCQTLGLGWNQIGDVGCSALAEACSRGALAQCREAVENGWVHALKDASEELRGERETMLAVVGQNGLALKYASAALRGDREIVLVAVQNNGKALQYASEELRRDREIVLGAVGQTGLALKFASEVLKADKEIVLVAVQNLGWALQFASTLSADREIVLAAVGQDGWALKFASEVLKADKEIVLAAVKNLGWALECASEDLKADREIVLAAVGQHGEALQFASAALRGDREIVLAAVQKNGEALESSFLDAVGKRRRLHRYGNDDGHLKLAISFFRCPYKTSIMTLRAAIVGYGRAGRVQLEAALAIEEISIVKIIDPRRSVAARLAEQDVKIDYDHTLRSVLDDDAIDAIIVTTPTSTHFDTCMAALDAGKHVFVEKPIAEGLGDIEKLYHRARCQERLLFTAYNRRYDPEWEHLIHAKREREPHAINVICRDYPFPPAAYLKTCGGIFRDAAVHDIDMVCRILDDDSPLEVDATLDCSGENSSIFMRFSRGCRVHMVHSRHARSYEQCVTIVLTDETVEFRPEADARGLTFQKRYEESYRRQLADFVKRVVAGDFSPNISLCEATSLERIVDACDLSARQREPVCLQTLRVYETAKARVRTLYRDARSLNTLTNTRRLLEKHAPRQTGTLSIAEVMNKIRRFVDLSDPDVELPNHQHALQTAESIRNANLPDWLQLVGLIHDFGKIIFENGTAEDGTSIDTQWSIVGDTFVVGCPLPDTIVYPEFNELHPDKYDTQCGIYTPGCGLDECMISYGHDEYLYRVLAMSETNLPNIALKIVRYHSLYAWHDMGAYTELENEEDRLLKGWVKIFNQHDLYSKKRALVDEQKVWSHYDMLEKKYLPKGLQF